MYNTTTIPTQYYISTTPSFFSALLSGCFLLMPFIGGIMHIINKYENENKGESEDTSDEEEEEEEEKYIEELNALPDRELTELDYKELQTKIVRETIGEDANGEENSEENKRFDIIMSYHKDSDTFWYYTDELKEVSYAILETVARKFVIENNCKRLYLQKAVEQPISVVVNEDREADTPKSSVFAKFKKYNTGIKGNTNYSNNIDIVEQTNHFRYKGKLYHYEESLQKAKEKIGQTHLDYATYKLLMQVKKEN